VKDPIKRALPFCHSKEIYVYKALWPSKDIYVYKAHEKSPSILYKAHEKSPSILFKAHEKSPSILYKAHEKSPSILFKAHEKSPSILYIRLYSICERPLISYVKRPIAFVKGYKRNPFYNECVAPFLYRRRVTSCVTRFFYRRSPFYSEGVAPFE